MKYKRPEYGDPSVRIVESEIAYSPIRIRTPRFETPITMKENFRRVAARDNPVWVTNGTTEIATVGANDIINHHVRGMQVHTDFLRRSEVDYDFKDWFNTDWQMVVKAGGAMLKPGTQLLDDITKWESKVEFPNLDEWGLEEKAAAYLATYDDEKVLNYDIGRGLTERLVSLMGGYTEGMMAMALEPDAVRDFFNRYADFVVELFDRVNSLYPLDMITYHDDWGTERDTFFSSAMFEDLVQVQTARIIAHVRSKNVAFQMHSCGNVTRFIPYVAEMGAEFLQIQRRAVDMPKIKRELGDKIGVCAMLEGGAEFGSPQSDDELIASIRNTVNIYAPGGGAFISVGGGDPRQSWLGQAELFYYSREFYEGIREF
jgi:hypothetical protein